MCSQWLVLLVKKQMTPSGACLALNRDEDKKKLKTSIFITQSTSVGMVCFPRCLLSERLPISEVQTRLDVKIFFPLSGFCTIHMLLHLRGE